MINRKSPEVRTHLSARSFVKAPEPTRYGTAWFIELAAVMFLAASIVCSFLMTAAAAEDSSTSADATTSPPESSSSTTHQQTPGKNAQSAPDSPFAAFATSKNRGPVSIQSESLTLDYKGNSVLFQGNVHATQADGQLSSKTLNVKYGKDFHEIQEMVAEGNVRLSQGLRSCTGEHGVMNQAAHTVILTGNPVCHDNKDQISGDKIIVHLDTGKSEVEGGVKAVIFPREAKTRDNEASADNTN